VKGHLPVRRWRRISRQCRGEAVASHDHPYQRVVVDPLPAGRISALAASVLAASAQVIFRPPARVRRKLRGTHST
jgi:hypothetical protein